LKKRNRGSRFRIRIRFPDTKTPISFFLENGYENEYVKNEQENEVGNETAKKILNNSSFPWHIINYNYTPVRLEGRENENTKNTLYAVFSKPWMPPVTEKLPIVGHYFGFRP